jgi:hypothetical protein
MVAEISDRRSDGQLGLILHETAAWRVIGPQGVVFCEVASLRIALDKAVRFAARGRGIVALVRGRPAEIVVFSRQVWTLANHLSELEVCPIIQTVKA